MSKQGKELKEVEKQKVVISRPKGVWQVRIRLRGEVCRGETCGLT